MKHKRDVRDLVKWAESLGWKEMPCRRHIKLCGPESAVVFTSKTPSCSRALKNAKAEVMRKHRAIERRAISEKVSHH